MSNLENYRSANEYREVLRILQNSTDTKNNFVWQSHAKNKVIVPIQRIEIDFIQREVFIQISSLHRPQLETDFTLFVKLSFKESVFKVMNFRIDQNKIYFSFPEQIKTIEYRRKPRRVFLPDEGKFITLKAGQEPQRDFGSEIKTTVCDISETGAGLIVSEQNRSFFKNNKVLWLSTLQNFKLPQPQLCEVVYINNEVDSNYINRKVKQVKIGLKFLIPLSNKLLDQHML